jgi:hypothetical protein
MGRHASPGLRLRRALFVVLIVAAATLILSPMIAWGAARPTDAAPPGPLSPACAALTAGWTTDPQGQPAAEPLDLSQAPIRAAKAGRHPCFDRVVFTVAGEAGGFRAEYVPELTSDPQGVPVVVPGAALMRVVIGDPVLTRRPPQAGDPVVNAAGFDTLVSVIFAGSFESITSLGVGLTEERPFRIFALRADDPQATTTMIVLDVSH